MDRILSAAQLITAIRTAVEQQNIELEIGTNFVDYNLLVSRARGQQHIAPAFDANTHHLNSENGFWIAGRSQSQELIHTQAVKRVHINGATLGAYLESFYTLFMPTGVEIDIPKSKFSLSPGAKQMQGDTFYHGDVWLADGPLYRGSGLNSLLTRLALVLTYLRWSPDYIFGFVPDALAYSGLAERESYLHNEPDVLIWKPQEKEETINGFMVWNSRADLEYVLELSLKKWPSNK